MKGAISHSLSNHTSQRSASRFTAGLGNKRLAQGSISKAAWGASNVMELLGGPDPFTGEEDLPDWLPPPI